MATKYTFNFSDTTKAPFDVQSYTSNGPESPSDPTLVPRAAQASTTLKLYGKGSKDYGEGVEQDLIYLLESFANNQPPVFSTEGQLWYNNIGAGSPPGPQLYIRTNVGGGSPVTTTNWTAVILASGTSVMTGELILSGIPTNGAAAVPKQFVDDHIDGTTAGYNLHLNSVERGYLDALTGDIQTQIDDKISRTGDVMDVGANLSVNGGVFLGLPATATDPTEAVSLAHLTTALSSGIGGDGVLDSVDWLPQGSPLFTANPINTTLQFTLLFPDLTTTTLIAEGVSRDGHGHNADEIILDNTFNIAYPLELQSGIEFIESNKADLVSPSFTSGVTISGPVVVTGGGSFTGTVSGALPSVGTDFATKDYVDSTVGGGGSTTATDISVTRAMENITATVSAFTPYPIQSHTAGDNRLTLSLNGLKQHAHLHGTQGIQYDLNVGLIDSLTKTGLDQTIDYDFGIDVDGVGNVVVTLTAGTNLTTHGNLVAAINAAMSAGSPTQLANAAMFIEDDDVETFGTNTSGTGSTISITNTGIVNQYLFAIDASPTAISSVTFLSDPPGLSPSSPDTLVITGDVTASFPVDKSFTIRGSIDPVYGTYDGLYRVHSSGAAFVASPGVTLIPVGDIDDSNLSIPLIGSYTPGSSPPAPVPTPSDYGDIHLTPIGGFDQILTAVPGLTGDYEETNAAGDSLSLGDFTSHASFEFDIEPITQIETTLLA